jgi:hypothetical protein
VKDKLEECSKHRFMESASVRQKPCECCSEMQRGPVIIGPLFE